jgi:hypothetical protein
MSYQKDLFLALFCLLCSGASVAGQTEMLEKRFRSEAPRKWLEYLELTKNSQGKITLLSTNHQDGTVRLREVTISKVRGSERLLQTAILTPEQRQHCWVKNDRYAFELRRKSETDSWLLVHLYTDLSNWPKMGISNVLGSDNKRAFSSLYLFYYWLPDLLKKSTFRITQMKAGVGPRNNLIRLDFTYTASAEEMQGRNRYLESGWIMLDPDRYWCITSYEIKEMPGSRNRSVVTETRDLRESPDGAPLLTKAIRRVQCPGEKTDVDMVEEYILEKREPSASEFTLSAFGLPEPLFGGVQTQPSRWYLWFIGGAVLCLGAAWLIRRRAARGAQTRVNVETPCKPEP